MAQRLIELDVRGRPCPVPIIEAAKAMLLLEPGDLLRVRATDRALEQDLAAWCVNTGHQLKSMEVSADEVVGCVRKGGPSRPAPA
jgi:tRNA 2-thiouridine synthesizing protein A